MSLMAGVAAAGGVEEGCGDDRLEFGRRTKGLERRLGTAGTEVRGPDPVVRGPSSLRAWLHQSSHCRPAASGIWSSARGTAGQADGKLGKLTVSKAPRNIGMNRPITRD